MVPKEQGGRGSRSLAAGSFVHISKMTPLLYALYVPPHHTDAFVQKLPRRKTIGLLPRLTRQNGSSLPVAEANHRPKTTKLVVNEARPQTTGTCLLAQKDKPHNNTSRNKDLKIAMTSLPLEETNFQSVLPQHPRLQKRRNSTLVSQLVACVFKTEVCRPFPNVLQKVRIFHTIFLQNWGKVKIDVFLSNLIYLFLLDSSQKIWTSSGTQTEDDVVNYASTAHKAWVRTHTASLKKTWKCGYMWGLISADALSSLHKISKMGGKLAEASIR